MSRTEKKESVVIRQANALTTAAYSLTRNEKRLVYMALDGIINNGITANEYGQYPVEIAHSEYISLFNDASKNVSRDIMAASKSLNKKEVIFYYPEENGEDGEKALDAMSWTTERSHRPKKGLTTLFFNSKLVSLITEVDKNFTKYLMSQAGKLQSPYAMRLYELLRLHPNKTQITHRVWWLIERFELPQSYLRMSDFRRRFLKPAIEEINRHTSMTVDYEEISDANRKNRVGSIKFTYNVGEVLVTPNKILGYKDAVAAYEDITFAKRLPTLAELENLKSHIGELIMDGLAITDHFSQHLREAMELAEKRDGMKK